MHFLLWYICVRVLNLPITRYRRPANVNTFSLQEHEFKNTYLAPVLSIYYRLLVSLFHPQRPHARPIAVYTHTHTHTHRYSIRYVWSAAFSPYPFNWVALEQQQSCSSRRGGNSKGEKTQAAHCRVIKDSLSDIVPVWPNPGLLSLLHLRLT